MAKRGRKKLPEGIKKIIRTYTIDAENHKKVKEILLKKYDMSVSKYISDSFDNLLKSDN